MRSFTCVSVVVYVARKLRPCPSYSRRRDRINLVLWRSLDKGGGVVLWSSCTVHLHTIWDSKAAANMPKQLLQSPPIACAAAPERRHFARQ